MAQKALGSCDLAGTHVLWLKKLWGHAIWLELIYIMAPKTRRKKEEENEALRANFFIRDRERSNNSVRKHSEFSCVCFLRCAASEFGTFGFQRLVSDFRGLFRSFGDK